MTLTSVGKAMIAHTLTGDVTTYLPLSTANACLGVGDGTAVFAASQTNLQAAGANHLRKNVNTAPTFSGTDLATITFVAEFTTAEANFAWQEDGIFNNVTNAAGQMLTRNVGYLITKTSSVSVIFTKTLTISV